MISSPKGAAVQAARELHNPWDKAFTTAQLHAKGVNYLARRSTPGDVPHPTNKPLGVQNLFNFGKV
jgi:hypothetical protein